MVVPASSTLTAVSIGSVSSRLAAGVTWPIAVARAPPSAVPASCGSSGSSGYSADGRLATAKDASPQVTEMPSGSSPNSTG